jgi:prolipoprotein diacylglyceryltransferase
MNTDLILSMGSVGFMLSMFFMGLLISYYGSSKTRTVGFVFLIVGAALAFVISPEPGMNYFADVSFMNGILAFIGGMIGGIIGIIVFLVAIIKS